MTVAADLTNSFDAVLGSGRGRSAPAAPVSEDFSERIAFVVARLKDDWTDRRTFEDGWGLACVHASHFAARPSPELVELARTLAKTRMSAQNHPGKTAGALKALHITEAACTRVWSRAGGKMHLTLPEDPHVTRCGYAVHPGEGWDAAVHGKWAMTLDRDKCTRCAPAAPQEPECQLEYSALCFGGDLAREQIEAALERGTAALCDALARCDEDSPLARMDEAVDASWWQATRALLIRELAAEGPAAIHRILGVDTWEVLKEDGVAVEGLPAQTWEGLLPFARLDHPSLSLRRWRELVEAAVRSR